MENNDAPNGHEVDPEQNQMIEAQSEEQEVQELASMESLLEEQGVSLDLPTKGELRHGSIATIRDNEILVSIGTKSEGVISGRELEQIPSEERDAFEIGMEIPVYVIAPEDSNGNVVLSFIRAREANDWETVSELMEANGVYDSEVIGYNKGGLIVPVGTLRGFVPASQISLLRRNTTEGETADQRFSNMVGDPMKVRVIEVDQSRRRLILSERLALQETRETLKDRLLEELAEGDVRSGRVTSLADFGAFVNIDGADGLVHMSEISWERIQHPKEVLEIGQEVQVKVISLDRDRKRIGLSIRQLLADPWIKKVEKFKEGVLVEGTVTHLTKFGAFARIDDDLEGLIHVSELSEQRVEHPKEVVHEGDTLTLRVIKIDPERRRIGLSLRKVDSAAYADLDWKMALADVVDSTNLDEDGEVEESVEVVVEADVETEAEEAESAAAVVDEVVEEAAEEAEEVVAEEETEVKEVVEETEEKVSEVEVEVEEPAPAEEIEEVAAEETEVEEVVEEAEGAVAEAEVEAEEAAEAAEEVEEVAAEDSETEIEAEVDEVVDEAVEVAEETADELQTEGDA